MARVAEAFLSATPSGRRRRLPVSSRRPAGDLEVTHRRVIDSTADKRALHRDRRKTMSRRDSLFFLFLFLLSSLFFPLLFPRQSYDRENDAIITNVRATIGGRPLRVRFTPHRFRFLPPQPVCLFLRLPLWFAPLSPLLLFLVESLSSLSRTRGTSAHFLIRSSLSLSLSCGHERLFFFYTASRTKIG